MTAAHLLAFNAALLAAILSPGPALLYAMRMTLVRGRAAGIATGVGLGVTAAAWTAAALFGLDRVFAAFPALFVAVKLAGAAYLIWVAVGMWRGADRPLPAMRAGRAVRGGIAVNLANPKAVLFAAAILAVVFPPGLTTAEAALIVANHLAFELAFYAIVATLLSRPAARDAYLGAKGWLDRGAAMVLGALGLRLLVAR